MDRLETAAWLEWWANSSTCLERFEVTIMIRNAGTRWEAQGILEHPEDREVFRSMCDLDSLFTLRFSDDSVIPVFVGEPAEDADFSLAESEPEYPLLSNP